jgi:hypothetical protein
MILGIYRPIFLLRLKNLRKFGNGFDVRTYTRKKSNPEVHANHFGSQRMLKIILTA